MSTAFDFSTSQLRSVWPLSTPTHPTHTPHTHIHTPPTPHLYTPHTCTHIYLALSHTHTHTHTPHTHIHTPPTTHLYTPHTCTHIYLSLFHAHTHTHTHKHTHTPCRQTLFLKLVCSIQESDPAPLRAFIFGGVSLSLSR